MARVRMFDVSGDEPGHLVARRALCFDQQSQFRRPPGPRRAHTPRQSGNGGGGGNRRTFCRRQGVGLQVGFKFQVSRFKFEAANLRLET